jgi:hypothetical protein
LSITDQCSTWRTQKNWSQLKYPLLLKRAQAFGFSRRPPQETDSCQRDTQQYEQQWREYYDYSISYLEKLFGGLKTSIERLPSEQVVRKENISLPGHAPIDYELTLQKLSMLTYHGATWFIQQIVMLWGNRCAPLIDYLIHLGKQGTIKAPDYLKSDFSNELYPNLQLYRDTAVWQGGSFPRILEFMVACSVDVNIRDDKGESLLNSLAKHFNSEHFPSACDTFKWLVKETEIDVKQICSETPLLKKCINYSRSQLHLELLKKGADPDGNKKNGAPLRIALCNDDIKAIRELIAYGANIHLVLRHVNCLISSLKQKNIGSGMRRKNIYLLNSIKEALETRGYAKDATFIEKINSALIRKPKMQPVPRQTKKRKAEDSVDHRT